MLAEIYGKMRDYSSGDRERSEDELTGNVFGNLRYLPFSIGLGRVLSEITHIETGGDHKACFEGLKLSERESDPEIRFWPFFPKIGSETSGVEPDILINLGDSLILIEVKYHNSLSSDDESNDWLEIRDGDALSNNQLARESRELKRQANGKTCVLLLLAKSSEAKRISAKVVRERKLDPEVVYGFITWEDVLEALSTILNTLADPYQKRAVEDITCLLTQKGFERFCGFDFTKEYTISCGYNWVFDVKPARPQIRSTLPFGFTIQNPEVHAEELWIFRKTSTEDLTEVVPV